MHKQIGLYLKNLERKKHVFQLVKNKKISIVLETKYKEYWLFFEDGQLTFDVDSVDEFVITRIGGEEEMLAALLSGEYKLRAAEANRHLKVSASFRNKLLLESLFYLGGQKSS